MLNDQLERFWHQEELPRLRNHTEEEQLCERHFIENVKRDETGRFIVRLPTKSTVELGKSKDQALKRFYALERRLERDENLKRLYCEFMNNYLDRGHMSRVQENEDLESAYFIPHQYVWRPDSITTKLRVVFDASARTTSGKSLNDKLMTGPNLQSELIDIILRFRSYNFVLTADIEGMFRQITVDERDRKLQCIVWRSNPEESIQSFMLNTVTYGTACAPYLAIRCLRQLAATYKEELPHAAKAIEEDCYMDDILSGAKNIQEARKLQSQLTKLLKQGQFQLRKWRSNHAKILEELSEDSKTDKLLVIDKEGAMKTLGIFWDAATDQLHYNLRRLSRQSLRNASYCQEYRKFSTL